MAKFNEQICTELCELHSEGLPQTDCADIVGIDRKTLYNWVKKGEKAKSGRYREFYINWMKADAKCKRFHINEINNSKHWQAHQYMLQVMDSERYVIVNKNENKNDNTHNFNELFDKELINELIHNDDNEDE